MITISLDEYGQFESEDKGPLFIAGVMFDAKNASEEKRERKRIEAYYKRVMADASQNSDSKEASFSYPEDLHPSDDQIKNSTVIASVKNQVRKTLAKFIQKGTYDDEALCDAEGKELGERQGEYHIFVMLKSDDGKKRLLSEKANMLAKDDWAANLYFHMASSVVNRIIFHNPLYHQGESLSLCIDIATRSTGNISGMDETLIEEFEKQAYKEKTIPKSDYKFYRIMDADIYRTLIAQEMVNSDNVSIGIEKFSVRSIRYTSEAEEMEFLYLSDSICSYLGYRLIGESADDWLEQITNKVQNMNPDAKNLIFGYDEIDNELANAWSAYEHKDTFKALSIVYDAKRKKGAFADYYRIYWFPYVEARVKESMTPELFSDSVNRLSAMLTVNNLDQEKLLYLMQQYEDIAKKVVADYKSKDMLSADLYKLYDAGVSVFCHIGDSVKALEYYEKCKQYAFYASADDYLRTNSKRVVCLEDAFRWEEALEVAKENVSNSQLALEIKCKIVGKDNNGAALDKAKAFSQLARIYAEMRKEQAEGLFRKALGMMEKDSANYKITQSYLLHYYADCGMQEAFDQEIQDYFDGRSTYSQYLEYIMQSEEAACSKFSREYALYVLARGLFCFHREELDAALWDRLCRLDETITENTGEMPSGHPWEITYKYLEMLAIVKKDEAARKKFTGLKQKCLKRRGTMLIAVEKFGNAEVAELKGDCMRRDKITLGLSDYMKQEFFSQQDKEFPLAGGERYRELQRYFTFMYH